MERFGGSEFTTTGCTARRKRSETLRRPRTNSRPVPNGYNFSPNDQNTLSSCKNDRKDNGLFGDVNAFIRNGNENKVTKVKLKLGGVTHTIHTKSTTEFASDGVSFAENNCYSFDVSQPPKIQEYIDASHSRPPEMVKSLHGERRKYLSISGSGFGDRYSSRVKNTGGVFSANEAFKSQSVRKSKRAPKRRVWEVGFRDDDEDEEIRYLGRLNASKVCSLYEDEGDKSKKSWSKVSILNSARRDCDIFNDNMEVKRSSMMGRNGGTKPKSEKAYDDEDYLEEEEPTSDDQLKVERKTLRRDSAHLQKEGKLEMTPTTHKLHDHATKDEFPRADDTVIVLPSGLLPSPRRKQKERPSEVDQQLKRVEAAKRRRLQSEKADREAQAEAIRKILGQDSARRKREEKMKKQRDEVAQVKAANSMTLAPSTVRWDMGPTGTIVTFSEDIGLPSIFNPVPCSYPPPREKCVGPNCTNSYKYRDSKSKLPLCSLLCYRAIHKEQPM